MMRNIYVVATLVLLAACSSEPIDDTLVLVSADQPPASVSESGCPYDDYAAFTGEITLQDGYWRLTKGARFGAESVRLSWNDGSYINIEIFDEDGWASAMDKGRVIYFTDSYYSKVTVLFYTPNERNMYPLSGRLYLIPQSDGSLEIDWCDLAFKKDYYDEELYAVGSGGIRITP